MQEIIILDLQLTRINKKFINKILKIVIFIQI